MTNKQLADNLKYSYHSEILVITHDFKLKVIVCPFEVLVLYEIGNLFSGQVVIVTEIKVTRQLITVYIINELPFYYYHFDILL